MPKVIVGMSGGVDSSTAAALLMEAGYEVEGLSLVLFDARGGGTGCCSLEAIDSARRVAGHIGIPHTVRDARDEFVENVINPFVEAYSSGITPNPCVLCNRHVKFPILMQEALKAGASLIATGHYAKVSKDKGTVRLEKGTDRSKDQSYFLYCLRPAELEMLMLPLGPFTKAEVRAMAEKKGLPASSRPESQEICFVEEREYSRLVCALNPTACMPGPIKDEEGRTIGTHKGIAGYTVGQRRGLGLSSDRPLYVTRIDAPENTISVGPRGSTLRDDLLVTDLNWLTEPAPVFEAEVKVRSTMQAQPATVSLLEGDAARVVFRRPQFAPAPGQAAVFYTGSAVAGGGTIAPYRAS